MSPSGVTVEVSAETDEPVEFSITMGGATSGETSSGGVAGG